MKTKVLDNVRIGSNLLGNIVMHCQECSETFAKHGEAEGKTVHELIDLAFGHTCDPAGLKFMQDLRAMQNKAEVAV